MIEANNVVAVTGATGFIGRGLIEALSSSGLSTRAFVSSLHRVPDNLKLMRGIDFVETGDYCRVSESYWSKLLLGCGSLVHCAGIKDDHGGGIGISNDCLLYKANVNLTQTIARGAAVADVRKFIFLSSARVYGESLHHNGTSFFTSDVPNPQCSYSESKYLAEQSLRDIASRSKLETTIIRPPLVYGTPSYTIFNILLKAVRHRIPLPVSYVRNRRSYLYIKNLVNFLVVCLNHKGQKDAIFNVTDDEDISIWQLCEIISKVVKRHPLAFPCPRSLLLAASSLVGGRQRVLRMLNEFRLDVDESKRHLAWTAPFTVKDAIADMFSDSIGN